MSKEVKITPKEIAKAIEYLLDENEQLKVELQEANYNIIWWSNRFNAVERDNKQLKEGKKKIIEYIKENDYHYMNEYALERFRNNLLEILGGKE